MKIILFILKFGLSPLFYIAEVPIVPIVWIEIVMIDSKNTGITYLPSSAHSQHHAMQQLSGIVIKTYHYKTPRYFGRKR